MSQQPGAKDPKSGDNDNDNNDSKEEKHDESKELGLSVHANNKADLLRITIESPEYDHKASDEDRSGVVLCCVVDVSGSMRSEATIKDDKGNSESHGLSILDLVKHSIKTIIHCLNKNDQLSIVSYSNAAKVELSLTKMDDKGRKEALNKLDNLDAHGGTNLWDGLEKGLDELNKEKSILTKNSGVFLFTDGLPNIRPGTGELGSLDKYIETNVNKGSLPGVINTYGFGYSLDCKLLNDIAIKGNGNYFFIPDSSFVGTIFVNSISNFCCNLARNVELKLKIDAHIAYSVLGGFNYQADEKNDVSNVTIKLGNVMYGQNKTVMIRFDSDDKDDEDEDDDGQGGDGNKNNDKGGDGNEGQVDDNANDNDNGKGSGTNAGIDIKSIVTDESLSYVSLVTANSINKACKFSFNNDKKKSKIEYYRLIACDTICECMEAMQLNDTEEAETELKKLIKTMSKDNVVKNNVFIKGLVSDLKGQVFEAIQSKDAYKKWGQKYLLSLIAAHLHCYNNNFKDPGVQNYGGQLFKTIKFSTVVYSIYN